MQFPLFYVSSARASKQSQTERQGLLYLQCHEPNPPYREKRVLKHGSQNLRPSTRFVSYVFAINITQSFRLLSVPRVVIFSSAARKPARKNGLEAHDLTVSAWGRSGYLKTHLSHNSKKSPVTIKKTNRQRKVFFFINRVIWCETVF